MDPALIRPSWRDGVTRRHHQAHWPSGAHALLFLVRKRWASLASVYVSASLLGTTGNMLNSQSVTISVPPPQRRSSACGLDFAQSLQHLGTRTLNIFFSRNETTTLPTSCSQALIPKRGTDEQLIAASPVCAAVLETRIAVRCRRARAGTPGTAAQGWKGGVLALVAAAKVGCGYGEEASVNPAIRPACGVTTETTA